MTRYADPHSCPDCGATIDPAADACTACALPLRGPVAQQLYATLLQADELLGRLRAEAKAVKRTPAYAPQDSEPRPAAPLHPTPRRAGLAAPTVPKILLGLGALCLLVAALVFLAVAWAILGVGGRTVVLVAMTAAAGGTSYLLATKDLRAGAESLAVVAFGLLALDVAGAENAGWLGDPGPGMLLVVTGSVLLVFGHLAAEVARTTAVGRLVSTESAAGVGAVLVVLGALTRVDTAHEVVLTLAVPTLVAAAVVAHRRGFAVLPALLGAGASVWWLVLLALGLARATEHHTLGELWGELEAWPALAAGLLALAVAPARRLGRPLRIAGAATAATIAVVLIAMPANFEGVRTALLTWLVLLVATAAATYLVPRSWWAVPAVPMLVSAVLPLVVAGRSLGVAAAAIEPTDVWHRAATAAITAGDPPVSPYLLLPTVLALAVAGIAGSRLTGRPIAPFAGDAVWLGALLVAGLLATLVLLEMPLLLVVLGLVVMAAGLAAEARRSGREQWLVGSAAVLLVALVAALASAWTTAIVLAVITAAAAGLTQRGSLITRPVGHAVLPPALAGLVWTAAEIGQLEPAQRAVPVLLLLGALAIVRPQVIAEVSAAVAATVAAGAAIAGATDAQGSLALHLTIAGALVTVTSLVNEERRVLGWLGGLLLAMATWVRLEQLGVTAPEPYTLPSAVALLVVGWLHLRRHPDASTYTALLPGLGLALVPSLLWALDDPISWRALAVGLVSAALVLAGALLRWSAPIVVGAVVGTALVLREASPALGSIHPWIVIGLVGTLLTALGVTWESRVREVRAAGDYLRRLR